MYYVYIFIIYTIIQIYIFIYVWIYFLPWATYFRTFLAKFGSQERMFPHHIVCTHIYMCISKIKNINMYTLHIMNFFVKYIKLLLYILHVAYWLVPGGGSYRHSKFVHTLCSLFKVCQSSYFSTFFFDS